MGIAAVSFKDKNGIEIVIYPQGEWDTRHRYDCL